MLPPIASHLALCTICYKYELSPFATASVNGLPATKSHTKSGENCYALNSSIAAE